MANGRVLREGPFEDIWIQPAAGDAGGALGSALFVWHQLLGNERNPQGRDAMQGALLGPRYEHDEIRRFLDEEGAVYHYYEEEEKVVDRIAELIASEQVVGHMAGRMEFAVPDRSWGMRARRRCRPP